MSQASASYYSEIQKAIFNDIIQLFKKECPNLIAHNRGTSQYKLGEIREFTSLVQVSQKEGVALSQTNSAPHYQRSEAAKSFNEIAKKIIALT